RLAAREANLLKGCGLEFAHSATRLPPEVAGGGPYLWVCDPGQRDQGLAARRAVELLRREKGVTDHHMDTSRQNALGQRVHPGADLWLVRHVTGLFEPELRGWQSPPALACLGSFS